MRRGQVCPSPGGRSPAFRGSSASTGSNRARSPPWKPTLSRENLADGQFDREGVLSPPRAQASLPQPRLVPGSWAPFSRAPHSAPSSSCRVLYLTLPPAPPTILILTPVTSFLALEFCLPNWAARSLFPKYPSPHPQPARQPGKPLPARGPGDEPPPHFPARAHAPRGPDLAPLPTQRELSAIQALPTSALKVVSRPGDPGCDTKSISNKIYL